ncbi:hypothetical protein QYQ99_03265 [Comamonas testosteroni]|uniref:hypothetical protein n=1 Tax=Comamonas testosteroni TaxID=285 RepID=UPI00265ECA32|nr:hypothetical protein [Comamonas testosteroni]WKL16589.1 hypothetical protein QYQ99_03265 [Comamonas testosteroni]
MFFDLPSDKTCIHPGHNPPTGLYIPPGKGYRHVCPGCKTVKAVIPTDYSLARRAPVEQSTVQGWKLVPIEPTEAQLATVRSQKSHPCAPDRWDSNNRRIYMRMLAAAPTPPGQESQPLTDGEIIAAQEALIEAKDARYRSRIGLQCMHCKKGTYRADGNGYYDFHRCDQCRYVPMWNADGTEFGIQEKPNGPSI